MNTHKAGELRTALFVVVVGSLACANVAQAQDSAEEWLQRMSHAVERSNYRGTVLRVQGGQVEPLRVVHKYEDGQVSEKLETLDGEGRTIIRDASGVRCILPESKAVLVEQSDAAVSLFGSVPVSMARLAGQYDVVTLHENQRVADRAAVLIAVRPHDEFRYGHRLWLDHQSGLPLKTELLDEGGKVIEELRFAEIRIEDSIPNSEFASKIDTAGYTFLGRDKRVRNDDAKAATLAEHWQASRLPAGFRLTVSPDNSPTGNDGVQHLMFDDGMASVSVFIEPPDYAAEKLSGPVSIGGANAFSVWKNDRQITAVGEVPLRTVREIANSINPVAATE